MNLCDRMQQKRFEIWHQCWNQCCKQVYDPVRAGIWDQVDHRVYRLFISPVQDQAEYQIELDLD